MFGICWRRREEPHAKAARLGSLRDRRPCKPEPDPRAEALGHLLPLAHHRSPEREATPMAHRLPHHFFLLRNQSSRRRSRQRGPRAQRCPHALPRRRYPAISQRAPSDEGGDADARSRETVHRADVDPGILRVPRLEAIRRSHSIHTRPYCRGGFDRAGERHGHLEGTRKP